RQKETDEPDDHGNANGSDKEQRQNTDQAAGRDRAQQLPQQGAQNSADDERGKQRDRDDRPDVFQITEIYAARGNRQRLTVDDANHAIDAIRDAAGEITAPELWRDDLVDDPPRRHVGQRTLEAVADLDPQMPVA